MKVIIPGGSGQVGRALARDFLAEGHEVVVLSRHAASGPARTVSWDGMSLGRWIGELDGADVVINLAGRSVNCRYHAKNRAEIMDSRVLSTRVMGIAIGRAKRPPRAWLQASTATIYADRYDQANDEENGIIGGGEPGAPDTWRFSIDVVRAWEKELDRATVPATRKVALRSAMIMGPARGGIFDTLLRLVRMRLGGRAGHGRQYVSWIHESDFYRALRWILDHDDLSGAVNVSSPNPLPYSEFMAALRRAAGVRLGLPAARWMIEVGAFLMRTESELVLKSRRVVPGRLLESGFTFDWPDWPDAARDLCDRTANLSR